LYETDDSHDEKHFEQRIPTPRGTSIHRTKDDANADDSFRRNPEFDSNEIDERNEQRISTPRGISIDRSEHDENADD
jgi:hypothetical protein